MIASRRSAALILACLVGVAGLALGASGCAGDAIVVDDLLEPIGPPQRWLPEASDQAAVALAGAALVDDAEGADRALAAIEEADDLRSSRHLTLLARDVRNAMLARPRDYRSASRTLLWSLETDPRLETRLTLAIDDDPRRLARRRRLDTWHELWARTFNTVAEPLGTSLITGFVLAPIQLGQSVVHYFAEFTNREPLPLTDRQALVHDRQYLAENPDADDRAKVERRIAKTQDRLDETLALRRVRAADHSLDNGSSDLALHHAEQAVRLLARNPDANGFLRKRARALVEKASRLEAARRAGRATSLEASERGPSPRDVELEARVATLLLADRIDRERLEPLLVEYAGDTTGDLDARGGVAEYVRAIVQHEDGVETGMWRRIGDIAGRDPVEVPMARHAGRLVVDEWQNPYRAHRRLERSRALQSVAYFFLGPWSQHTRYPNLPTPVAYLLDSPAIATTVILSPVRAIFSLGQGRGPDFQRPTAVAGYRYLARYPDGEHDREVIRWLFDYHGKRGNPIAQLALADYLPELSEKERHALVDAAGEAQLGLVSQIDSMPRRNSIIRDVATTYPDSASGKTAGNLVRQEALERSPQKIGISKSFLLENPRVAGPEGLGLRPTLLNDVLGDGELHPDGVTLLGGRSLEIHLIAEGGDENTEPDDRILTISDARLARTAAMLEEVSERNLLVDSDAAQGADAQRDHYLERARLGLTDDVDTRPAAQSTYVYRSLRERYGLVRGRESVLPFDLVLRGSFYDMSLGAFPRWRPPRETPDAFLYR